MIENKLFLEIYALYIDQIQNFHNITLIGANPLAEERIVPKRDSALWKNCKSWECS